MLWNSGSGLGILVMFEGGTGMELFWQIWQTVQMCKTGHAENGSTIVITTPGPNVADYDPTHHPSSSIHDH